MLEYELLENISDCRPTQSNMISQEEKLANSHFCKIDHKLKVKI